jgi:hypothetical protein
MAKTTFIEKHEGTRIMQHMEIDNYATRAEQTFRKTDGQNHIHREAQERERKHKWWGNALTRTLGVLGVCGCDPAGLTLSSDTLFLRLLLADGNGSRDFGGPFAQTKSWKQTDIV